MKKSFIFVLMICISLVLSSCGSSDPVTEADETASAETVTTAPVLKKTEPKTTKQTEETAAGNETPADDDYRVLYKDFLLDYIKSGDYKINNGMFDLFDFDSDGIPELVVSLEDYHAAGAAIYTVYNNKVVCLDENMGSFGTVRASSGKYIVSHGWAQGEFVYIYFEKDNDKLKEVIKFVDDSQSIAFHEGYTSDEYLINDEPVSEEKFSRLQKEYDDGNYEQIGRKYKLDEKEIINVFSNLPEAVRPADYRTLYKDFLLDYIENIDRGQEFDLCDLDSDGIPELVISPNAGLTGAAIYTAYNGEVICLAETIGAYGVLYVFGNEFASMLSHSGIDSEYFFRKNGNSIEEVISFVNQQAAYEMAVEFGQIEPSDVSNYTINDEPVSEEKYNKVRSEYLDRPRKEVGKQYKLDKETVEQVFDSDI